MTQNIDEIYDIKYVMGKWIVNSGPELSIQELSDFYSMHYGVWSHNSPHSKGKPIRLSSNKLKEWLDNDMSELWTARKDDVLVGYAIVLRGKSASKENVIWVTQFVIHENHRNIGIGKYLLFNIWGFSSYFAWGLVTANPYAVRALEKATHRRCEPSRIKRNFNQLFNFGKTNICYIGEDTAKEVSDKTSKINTEFYVDHSALIEMLSNTSSNEKPWLLGSLEDGWEWFAFTFKDQLPIELTASEIQIMLNASDKIARDAYSRMPMDDSSHKWASFTEVEVDFILKHCNLTGNDSILDIGCGMGRHSIELSRRGLNVIGIDYSKELINSAISKATNGALNVQFLTEDILSSNSFPAHSFDCILCLYDVIGSYADNQKNIMIIDKISQLLKKGGKVILSVMNLELTEKIAKHTFNIEKSSTELLNLPSSNTMESSGNIFNPDFFLIDNNTKVVYRKEEFSFGKSYPIELVVRDRRFYMAEIENMCEEKKLKVLFKQFVSAGWQKEYSNTDNKAKEILLVCEKI